MTPPKERPPAAESDQGQQGDRKSIHTHGVDVALLRRSESALRGALKEGLEGPEVERLRDWVAQHRMKLRRARARARLSAVLTEIEGGQDG